jgi:hypothetical protein
MTPINGELTATLTGMSPLLITPFALAYGSSPSCLLTLTPKALLVSEGEKGAKLPSAGV